MHEGHRDRLRARFKEEGLDGFKPHEVLELLLFYAIPRRNTNDIAHELIKKYGSLAGVFNADIKDLATVKGISENSAFLISLIPSLARIYFKDRWGEKPILNSSQSAGEYVKTLFTGRENEVFYLICLDTQNNVTATTLIHEGTINEAAVYPREIVHAALRHKANSVILAHNHPGGSLRPSKADVDVTQKLCNALSTIDIKVLDHFIVAGEKFYSFAENGMLK